MKKVFSFSLAALACAMLFAGPQAATAQDDADELDNPLNPTQARSAILIGPRLGISRNYHSGGFRTINDPLCPVFNSGSGWGYYAGITAEYIPYKATWSIIPAVTYESRPGSFKQSLEDAQVILPHPNNPDTTVSVLQTVSTTSEITYEIIAAEVMYKQEFASIGKAFRVSAAAGPSVAYVLDGKITQQQDLEQPLNARFAVPPSEVEVANNGRRLIYANNRDIPGRKSLRFSLKGGVQAEIGLFKNALIMYPGVFYDFGLTNVTDNENWGLNSLLFQVDFRRAF